MAIVARRLIIIFSSFIAPPLTAMNRGIVHHDKSFPFIVLVTMLAMGLGISKDHCGASKNDFGSESGTTSYFTSLFTCLLMMVVIMSGQSAVPLRSRASQQSNSTAMGKCNLRVSKAKEGEQGEGKFLSHCLLIIIDDFQQNSACIAGYQIYQTLINLQPCPFGIYYSFKPLVCLRINQTV